MKDIAEGSNFVIDIKNLHLLLFENDNAYPPDMALNDALISVDGTEPRHVTSVRTWYTVSGWKC